MKKLIIVPIDFSNDSINALEHAIRIANEVKADIQMINVRKGKDLAIPSYFKDFDLIFGNTTEGYFKVIMDLYKNQVDGHIDFKIREGRVHLEVCNQAKYNDAYMIVMGTHGISGFEEFWVGSNAYKVVSEASCPVMTVRNGYVKKEIKKIILPIDITKNSRKKVPLAADLALAFGAEIHVIGVRETNSKDIIEKLENYVAQAAEYFKTKKVKCSSEMLVGENIANLTIEYAKKVDGNLILSMTEQIENTYNLWLGAYAQQLINHSPIPVITIKE